MKCQETTTIAGRLFVCINEHDDDRHYLVREDRA